MRLTLYSQRLILRNFKLEDAESMYTSYCCSDKVTKYLSWYTHQSLSVTQEYLTKFKLPALDDDLLDLAITLKDNVDCVLGSIGFVDIQDGVAEVGYVIAEAYWNQGMMSEALNTLIDYAFTSMPIHKITAIHHVDNIGSGRVMEKCGMHFTGLTKTKRKIDSEADDLIECKRYELEKTEWTK